MPNRLNTSFNTLPKTIYASGGTFQYMGGQPPPSSSGSAGTGLRMNASSIIVSGSGAGTAQYLRGTDIPMDSQGVGGWNVNPGGTYFGFNGPSFPQLQAFGVSCIRVTLNANLFFNSRMGVLTGTQASPTWGTDVQADPGGNYKTVLLAIANGAVTYGMNLIWDLHWTAPDITLGAVTKHLGAWGQSPGLDGDTGLAFWTAGVGAGPIDYNGNATTGFPSWLNANCPAAMPISIFEIFNENYFDNLNYYAATWTTGPNGTGTSMTYQQCMLNGGYTSLLGNQYIGNGGRGGIGIPTSFCTTGFNWPISWKVGGFQQVLNGIRANGFNNILACGTASFAHQLCDWGAVRPTDTVSPPQVCTTWHAYEYNTTGYPYASNGSCDTGTNGTASALTLAGQITAGTAGQGTATPLLLTEYAPTNCGSGATDSTFGTKMHNWMNSLTRGTVGATSWVYNPGSANNPNGTGTSTQLDFCYGSNISFTASQSSTTLTLTSAAAGLTIGAVLTSGGTIGLDSTYDRPYIVALLTGTLGASGSTYQMSGAASFGASSMVAVNLTLEPIQGTSNSAWWLS